MQASPTLTRAAAPGASFQESPWPLTLRLAGYVTCAGAAAGIGIEAGANHPVKLAAVLAGSAAFALAFHVLASHANMPPWAPHALVAGQLAVALAMLFAAGCMGAELLMFVLTAELQLVLALRLALAGTVTLWLLTILAAALVGVSGSGQSLGEVIATSPAGFAFVAAFTHNALGERRQRLRATKLLHELNEAHAQLQFYAEQVEELAVARERNRIAGEIHDTLGHYLTVINIQLETAKKLQARDQSVAMEALTTAKTQAAEALKEVRRSVAALRPAALEMGLAEALAGFIDSLRNTTELEVHLETHSGGRLRPEVEVAAYRVIQEALTNVRKHAAAGNVWIRLRWNQDAFDGSIRDDGCGAGVVDGENSFGLQSMRERLGGVNGTLRIETRPGTGFVVAFHIPSPLTTRRTASEPEWAMEAPATVGTG